jgi:hypothetical protein
MQQNVIILILNQRKNENEPNLRFAWLSRKYKKIVAQNVCVTEHVRKKFAVQRVWQVVVFILHHFSVKICELQASQHASALFTQEN